MPASPVALAVEDVAALVAPALGLGHVAARQADGLVVDEVAVVVAQRRPAAAVGIEPLLGGVDEDDEHAGGACVAAVALAGQLEAGARRAEQPRGAHFGTPWSSRS